MEGEAFPVEKQVPAGFAKLQGEDFEYYVQSYSIMIGRNSKKSMVDLDLAGPAGGLKISRNHARIYYDFDAKCFCIDVSLSVFSVTSCLVCETSPHSWVPKTKLLVTTDCHFGMKFVQFLGAGHEAGHVFQYSTVYGVSNHFWEASITVFNVFPTRCKASP